MTFCTITPTRGDRPELLEFCKYQLSRMTLKPERSYFIDYKPVSDGVDLLERVQKGVEMAKAGGFDLVFIIEDDDAYPADYFQRFDLEQYAFMGSYQTVYYNLRNRTFNTFNHAHRSSLFTTAFRISALEGFIWQAPRRRFLDIALWEYAENMALPRQLLAQTGAIGIKHNLGLCAGKGHVTRGANVDESLQWLKDNTDAEQFEFYSRLMKKL